MRKSKFKDMDFQERGVRESLKEYMEDASIRDMVALYFINYKIQCAPRINRDESIYVSDIGWRRSHKEWRYWRDLRETIYDYGNILAFIVNQWAMHQSTITSMMDTWEALKVIKAQNENRINAIPSQDEREKEIAKCTEELSTMKVYGASINVKTDKDGHIAIDISGHIAHIKSLIQDATDALIFAKSAVTTLEKFCREYDCEDLVDSYIQEDCNMAKLDGARSHPEWSMKALKRREAKGEAITDEEREMAIFPYYEGVKPDAEECKDLRDNLNRYLRIHKVEEDLSHD